MGSTTAGIRPGPATSTLTPGVGLKFRGTLPLDSPRPLPPLPVARRAVGAEASRLPEAPAWSPVRAAVPLFAVVWVCFAALTAGISPPPAAEVAGLGQLLAMGTGVVALVLLTLSVALTQVTGRGPCPAAVGVAGCGVLQGFAAQAIGSGHHDLWGVGGWVLVLVGIAVPLAWVGAQFQCGVRRQRFEYHVSLTASWIERARHQAHQTVQSVHRHDVRSMLFVIDGAARTLADETLPAEQRTSFGEMLAEGVERLGALIDVRSEEIEPFAVDGVARAVVHAERKAGRPVTAELPAPLTAVGRAADVAAVLRTVVAVVGRKASAGVQLRGEVEGGAVVVRIGPTGTMSLPLLTGIWEEIWAESFKPTQNDDEESIDLYVAARLLAEQGGDFWSTAGRAGFAVRLPAVGDIAAREGA